MMECGTRQEDEAKQHMTFYHYRVHYSWSPAPYVAECEAELLTLLPPRS